MGNATKARTRNCYWFAFHLALQLLFGKLAFAQIRYTVPEEVKDGTVVGNVARDLGLDFTSLTDRRFRVVSGSKEAFFEVNQDNGALYVHRKIDREELCQGSGACLMELKILVENPLEMHHIVVEITDVNDHSPSFPKKEQKFDIGEQTLPGRRFQLHTARDPDAGINSIRTYTLTSNEHFEIDIRQSDEDKIPFLVLKKSLDREQNMKHSLLVTAIDGGKPPRSGALNVSVIVLDSNDNRPMFSQEIYEIILQENVPVGTTIFQMNATDPDEDTNGEIEYSLGNTLKQKVYDIFELDKITGEIIVKGMVDFEENDIYRLDVQASDKGQPPLTGRCRVIIKIKDVNDNPPEIEVTSLSNTVSEDSKPGTVISLISVTDKDSGVNGKIISRIINNVPFELKPSYKENIYSVVTKDFLDREEVSQYEITIKATDCGEPPLGTVKTFTIHISDVNDNCPQFSHNPLQFYLVENNLAGASIFAVSAKDNDANENAAISYHIVREHEVTSFLNVNSDNGHITALRSFDFETLKTFQFQVVASDKGPVPLTTDKSVMITVLDVNDNAPEIEVTSFSSSIKEDSKIGTTVALISVSDSDSGINGKVICTIKEEVPFTLAPSLQENMFAVVTRSHLDREMISQYDVTIIAKDTGEPSFLTEKTISVVVSDVNDNSPDTVLFPLISAVIYLFNIVIITDKTFMTFYILSGDKRYMLVGPRMSIGSTIVSGSHSNTLVLPDRRRASEEVSQLRNSSYSSKNKKQKNKKRKVLCMGTFDRMVSV
uniref:Cadherin domain-containing protein n=1 Tax=Acanthochromis polyacanthus TaxID=80966 RepID=A0A3Q1FW44_9TELE